MEKNNLTLVYAGIIILAFAALIIVSNIKETPYEGIKKFTSAQEIKDYLQARQSEGSYYGSIYELASMSSSALSTSGILKSAAQDYSTTNIQVQGVDEGDIVKNDGKYIYTVSGSNVFIIDANPDTAKILSNISMSGIKEIYLNGDKLILISNYYETENKEPNFITGKTVAKDFYYYGGSQKSVVQIYDISDKYNPKLIKNLTLTGQYSNSRMIGDYVYLISNKYESPIVDDKNLPDIYYFEDDYAASYSYVTITSINVNTKDIKEKTFLMNNANEMYVSNDNIYLTYQKTISRKFYVKNFIKNIIPLDIRMNSNITDEEAINKWLNNLTEEEKSKIKEKYAKMEADLQKEMEKSVAHKIEIKNGDINYKSRGEFPGHVLNQFSMDEYKGFFRVATTTGQVWGGSSKNHVYVLDSNLKLAGAVEDLAPGETIYSARFMGDRAYVVTFKKVDPLFVLDLKDPFNPTLKGKLKIPGYSDYLHPYDENHLIGIGKDAKDAEDELVQQRNLDFAWYQGVKISLFDVTDIEKPKEISSTLIGDRGSDSYALRDHKAFLFNKEKNMLVIPILVAKIDKEKYPNGVTANTYGDYVDQGAYVFDISLDGIKLRGSVGHGIDFEKSGYYYDSLLSVKRSLYIGNNLYTISDSLIKINDLTTLKDVNKIKIPVEKEDRPILYY